MEYTESFSSYVIDPNGDSLAYTKVSGSAWLTVAGDGTLSGAPSVSDLGINSCVVEAADSVSGVATSTLNIKVSEQSIYEAEDAVLINSTFSAFNVGYTGSGYAVMTTAGGSDIEWTVNLLTASLYDFSFRHWTESSNTMSLKVNGVVVDSSHTLAGTSGAWVLSNIASLPLNAVLNSIRLTRDNGLNNVTIEHLLV